MLSNDWRIHGTQNGGAGDKANEFLLFASDQKKHVSIEQKIHSFDKGTILRLSADMKCTNVQTGKKPWHLARLVLVQHNGQKDRWDFPHLVASLTGTRDWETRSQYFTIDQTTQTIRVVGQLSQSTGSFWLKNIHLYPVNQTKIYTQIKTAILVSWGLFAVFLIGSYFFYGNKKTTLQVMLVLAFVAIIIGTTMPAKMKTQVSKQIGSQINEQGEMLHLSPGMKSGAILYMQKAGHFSFFLLFALVLSMVLNREPTIWVITHILLLAAGTEIAQLYVDGRTPLLADFAIDALGGFLGILLMRFPNMVSTRP